MATVGGVNTSTGVDGNLYTNNVSNDQLSTNDFLKLMMGVLEIPCQSDKIQILRVDNGTRDKL